MRIALLLLIAGCSDYALNGNKPSNGGDTAASTDSTRTESTPLNVCDDPDLSAVTSTVDESCVTPPTVGSWTPVVEWHSDAPGDAYASPVVGQLTDDNGDGLINDLDMPDIVVANAAGAIFVLSGDGGRVHWQAGQLGSEPSTPAIADLDGDGRAEVIAAGSSGVVAFHGDTGAVYWNSQQGSTQAICGGVGVADLEGDGRAEIIIGGTVLEGRTGRRRFTGSAGQGTGYSGGMYASFGVAADIDQDGVQEVVVGNALYSSTGSTLWTTGQSDGFVAVANFDNDPQAEIVVSWFPGMVRLQDDNGRVLWSGSYTGSTVGPPTIADFDGDGRPEIGVAGNNVYVVIDEDGTRLWTRNVTDVSSGFTGSSVFDFEGDGQAEVVYADENDLWVFAGADGAVKMRETYHSSATCSENPTIADVDNDGHAEIIYTSSTYSENVHGVTVVGDQNNSWQPAPRIWNQHAWSITNVSDSSGTIPRVPVTNWLSYNNFRSGDLAAANEGAVQPDAVPMAGGVCTDECDNGKLTVVFYLGSGSTSDLPANVPVALYAKQAGDWVLLETRTISTEIASGSTSEGILFELDPANVPAGELRFVVDDNGTGTGILTECHEDNNVLVINEGLCP